MSHIFETLALVLLLPGLCPAQAMPPLEALDRYLARARDPRPACSDVVFAVQIDAALPKLKRQASMSGFKRISRAGQIVYRGLRFTGDNVVKTNVIARFLATDSAPPEPAADTAVTTQNYVFQFEGTSDYNGLIAHVFRLRPKRKRAGLFEGELWLDANTAAPLRLWGDMVKSPSIFIRSFRFVQDYQKLDECSQPLRLLLTFQSRIAGEADLAVWLRPVDGRQATGPAASRSGGDPGMRGTTSSFED